MASEVETKLDCNEKVASLKEKISRTTKFLKELKALSKTCREVSPSLSANPSDDPNDEAVRERQLFMRRIMQLKAEIEDSRDLILALCKEFLPESQWRLIAQDFQEDCGEGNTLFERTKHATGWGMLNGFDIDPSVRFFGIDWGSIFGRCFSLSLNTNIFGDQILTAAQIHLRSREGSRKYKGCDLVLVNRILRDLASLEADVTSHAEAILQGRLSKSQRKLIQREQLKHSVATEFSSSWSNKSHGLVSKSLSFRDPLISGNVTPNTKPKHGVKYSKNKTTNFDKLLSSPDSICSKPNDGSSTPTMVNLHHKRIVESSPNSQVPPSKNISGLHRKNKSSFIHSVSEMLRNIR